jgi:outer membrane protein TolC
VDADYGTIGQTFASAHSTYTMMANIRIPVFDAGRTTARRIETASALRQREAELADFRNRVEYDVRSALLDLRAADQQLQAAQTNVQLAGDELQQARDRFAAGVAGNLEVTQAQEAVASASDTYVSALYSHNLAKASLARALGIAESAVTAYLGGRQ